MRRAQLWLAGLVVLGLAGAAPAQGGANPAYTMWAAWREGASVTLKTESVVDGKVEVVAKHTQTLKKVTAEKVVIEMTFSTEAGGMTFQAPPQSMEIPAKMPNPNEIFKDLPKAAPQGTPQAVPKSKETKGREALTVNGKKLNCEWTQIEDEDGSVTKVWASDDMPGQTVKVVAKRQGSTDTGLVVDWKGTKK
jgi:hypothetical protein